MWTDYAVPGGTFRENLYGQEGQTYLPDHHPGHQFKWNVAKKPAETASTDEKVAEQEVKKEDPAVEEKTSEPVSV